MYSRWQSIGGLKTTVALSKKNLEIVEEWVNKIFWLEFLAKSPKNRSCTSICLSINDERFNSLNHDKKKYLLNQIVSYLEKEKVAYDINSYRDAPLGIRIWGGATVIQNDISILMSWIEWSYENFITNKVEDN